MSKNIIPASDHRRRVVNELPPELLAEAEQFNRDFPVGAAVDVLTDDGEIRRTTVYEPAAVCGAVFPEALVWVRGVAYGVEINRVTRAVDKPTDPPAGRQPPAPPADVPGQLTLFNVEQSALGGGR